MSSPKQTSLQVETFVLDLFKLILGRREVGQPELKYWTSRSLETDDPIITFYEFVNSKEAIERREKDFASNTIYNPGHFYSPVVNKDELKLDIDRVYAPKNLLGIDLNVENQIEILKLISPFFNTMPFDDCPKQGLLYYYDNTSYGFGDACVYWGMLGLLQPSKILEIGSGFTSALALDAINHYGLHTACTFVDPYPDLVRSLVGNQSDYHHIIPSRVQDLDLSAVNDLAKGDLLFIDSSHVIKTGSDVHFELFEMLPRVQPGVIVHFHDIFFPFEYPRKWTLEDNRSWNELYFIQSFLMFNKDFEIVYFNDLIAKEHGAALRLYAASLADRISINPGGGLWLRRR